MPRATSSTTPGQRVRDARLAAGLTQAQLAERAGLHRITMTRIETGEYDLSIETALDFARVLGVPPSQLHPRLAAALREFRPTPGITLLRSDAGGWIPADGSLDLAREVWPELPGSVISDGRLVGGIRRAIERGIPVEIPALPPLV